MAFICFIYFYLRLETPHALKSLGNQKFKNPKIAKRFYKIARFTLKIPLKDSKDFIKATKTYESCMI
ncbi:hypothetical protein CQA40_09700 [Helicobacter sp. MIT 01-3238]|nr:hypothetical protein CQA40_09700 [Helicobacter sp. MIT 01-3238]